METIPAGACGCPGSVPSPRAAGVVLTTSHGHITREQEVLESEVGIRAGFGAGGEGGHKTAYKMISGY